jgi:bidirectional [NiFe] hydrogenase diaphorase subunit
MSELLLQIDGKEVKASEGMTIYEAARSAGIAIPTLCHHEKLSPYGACRICTVEAEVQGRKRLVASCVYPVEPNMIVATRSEKVDRTRKVILEELMAHAPESEDLVHLAEEYGAEKSRFEKESAFCILCGLCVRYCAEVKGKNAVGFSDRGPRREISFIPEIAAKECWNCKECFPLCPTSYVQAVYVLTEAVSFPGPSPESLSKEK